MATTCPNREHIQGHPCFGGDRRKFGRLHLPVAPACNIKCGYCTRRHDCVSESRPGATSRVLTPRQALAKVRVAMEDPQLTKMITVVGIAGPGDPLANEQTFETFRLVNRAYPHLIKCLSTNGLALPDRFEELLEAGLGSLTVTINATDPLVGARIYSDIRYGGATFQGPDGARLLIERQLQGVALAAGSGIPTKVNTVFIPGVNDDQIGPIARTVKELGAVFMNIMPVIPQEDFAYVRVPSPQKLNELRDAHENIIVQFRHCSQCRADAVGLIGQSSPGGLHHELL